MNEKHAYDSSKDGALPGSLVRVILPLIVVALAAGVTVFLIKTAPKAQRRPPHEMAALVKTTLLQKSTERVVLTATGTVVPARSIILQARVSGEVVGVSSNFVPGGRFEAGDEVLCIDPRDYELAVENRKADVARANQTYAVELGQQEIAKHEWESIPERDEASELERSLTLREPQLRSAEAASASALATLARAELDLQRTRVCSPFNALLTRRHVELGAQVQLQTPLAEIVGTDMYWVEVTLPGDTLRWVLFPDSGAKGSAARIRPTNFKDQPPWMGSAAYRRPNLEDQGRLAQIVVAVPSPLEQGAGKSAPLLLGAYVEVEIDGPELDDVFAVPRTAVHDGNTLWLLDNDSRLAFRQVDIVWQDRDVALVKEKVEEGEKLVLTQLASPVPGMLLQEEGTESDRRPDSGERADGRNAVDTSLGGLPPGAERRGYSESEAQDTKTSEGER